MNKTAIKNFSTWARRKLISEITYKAGMLGITDEEIAKAENPAEGIQVITLGKAGQVELTGSDITSRNKLISRINAKAKDTNYKTAFENVMEEVAYTWFNRLIAIRFMEVNDYLPSGIELGGQLYVCKDYGDRQTMTRLNASLKAMSLWAWDLLFNDDFDNIREECQDECFNWSE